MGSSWRTRQPETADIEVEGEETTWELQLEVWWLFVMEKWVTRTRSEDALPQTLGCPGYQRVRNCSNL